MTQPSRPPTESSQDIVLTAQDGYKLAATQYTPQRAAKTADGRDAWLLIGSATGVPRGFYKRFAQAAADRGLHVITTDYRGIGGSKPKANAGSLKGFKMTYADWSTQDLAAAQSHAQARGRVWLVGHSLAGHAIGQLPEVASLEAALVCGAGAGWSGYMPGWEPYKVWFMWNVLGPVSTRLLGYHAMSRFGAGEDIPMGVYTDWKRWCQYPNYFFDDPTARDIAAKFKRVRIPVAAINSTDDLWAMPASRGAFFKHFTGTQVDRIDISATQMGTKSIGHMGYYRQSVGDKLWPTMFAWLESHGLPVSPD